MVAVCFDPDELSNQLYSEIGAEMFEQYLLGIVEAANERFVAVPVTYEEVTLGGLDGMDVAYFFGGRTIITTRPEGFDAAMKSFAENGGGVIGHSGAAAAFTNGLTALGLITLPGAGLLPFEAEISLMQMINLILGTLTGSIPLRAVTVEWETNPLGFTPGSMSTYAWDGEVAFPENPGEGISVFARVVDYDGLVDMSGIPFFVAGDCGEGKVILSPGSPELIFNIFAVVRLLEAEILYVSPESGPDPCDFDLIYAAYGATPSSPHWIPEFDVAEPYGLIDVIDIVRVVYYCGL